MHSGSRRLTATIAIGAAFALALGACTPGGGDAEPDPSASPAAPADGSVVAGDAAAQSLAASELLFDAAPGVLVAPAGDADAQRLAAAAAAARGLPLLVDADGADDDDAVLAEVERLGAAAVVVVGGADAPFPEDVATRVAPSADDVGRATGVRVGDGAGVAELAGEPAEAGGDAESLAATTAPGAGASVALVLDEDDAIAAAATARAAGAAVTPIDPSTTDVLRDGDAVAAIAASPDAPAVLIGAGLAGQPDPAWSVAAARGADPLPGGGLRVLGDHQVVALYGTPGVPVLGLLGEQGPEETVARAAEQAAAYEPLSDRPVVPALEVIATIAAGDEGDDGDYSTELSVERLRPTVEAALDAGQQVILDLQPGRSDFLPQAERYRELLELPGVGLALDPEWRLAPDEVPLEQIGAVSAEEVNRVADWLADLVETEGLPPKLFVLHQFRLDMLPDREAIDTSHPQLETVIHADGQGGQGDKQATWRALHQDAPAGVGWGWKNFIDEDEPMLTPEETMTQVEPLPDLVTYQ